MVFRHLLTVETCNIHVESNEDGLKAEIAPGYYSVIAVSDTGQGISAETVAHAFEPFFTTKPVGKGSGLGLSMIYGFAMQSGGQVKIYSEPGHGTCVRLYLPRAEVDGFISTPEISATSLPTGDGETILLVEDSEGVRRITERQLSELGYRVVSAESGAQALALLDEHPEVDLLFTDIVMPGGMNGIELSNIAVERFPELKVLQTSGFTQPAMQSQQVLAGLGTLLSKPYRKSELATRVREALDRADPESNGIDMMKRLIIVDDEPAITRLVEKVATGCGFEVTATNDPETFMDELIKAEVDAIVMDLSLPNIDGVELLRFISTIKCRAKILIISGFDPRVLETSARLGGAMGLNIAGTFSKPLRVADLRDALAGIDEGIPS